MDIDTLDDSDVSPSDSLSSSEGNVEVAKPSDDGMMTIDVENGIINPGDDDPSNVEEGDFYENLCGKDWIDYQSLTRDLIEAVRLDDSSREKWKAGIADSYGLIDTKYKEQEEPFKNACGVTSPLILNALIYFVSQAEAELLPAKGPVRARIEGDSSSDGIQESADRITQFANYFLTSIAKEYYSEHSRAFLCCGLLGTAFTKSYNDPALGRPVVKFVHPEEIVVNNSASSIADAERITHVMSLSDREYKAFVNAGIYVDDAEADRGYDYDSDVENDQVVEARFELDGVSTDEDIYLTDDIESSYKIYEIHVYLDIGDSYSKEGTKAPYIVTISTTSKKIVGFYRNWEKDDPKRVRKEFFVKFGYFPGFGFFDMGLAQIAGGAAKSSTELMRILVNTGILSNFPSGMVAKSAKFEKSDMALGPGQWAVINDMGRNVAELFSRFPINEPSPTLIQLKDQIEDSIKQITGTLSTAITDFNPNAPVGTTLALLDESGKVQLGVVNRLVNSMTSSLSILLRLFKESVPFEGTYPYLINGEVKKGLLAEDLETNVNLVPVCDPSCVSRIQRLMVNDAVFKTATQFPQLHDMHAVLSDNYRGMGVEEAKINVILPPPAKPFCGDPISENIAIKNGKPIMAALYQEHLPHIIVHQNEITEQARLRQEGAVTEIQPWVFQLQDHIEDHKRLDIIKNLLAEHDIDPDSDEAKKICEGMPRSLEADIAKVSADMIEAENRERYERETEERLAQMESAPADPAKMEFDLLSRGAELNERKFEHEKEIDKLKLELAQEKLNSETRIKEMSLNLDILAKKIEQLALLREDEKKYRDGMGIAPSDITE